MSTPIPRILLALEGRIDFIKTTTPGFQREDETAEPSRADLHKKVREMFGKEG